ncbi:MAG TPA: hypothetical protein VHV10_02290 [Ktedonobacteraceae bacterium]|jgi:hypothetical protein|nr:hypothetical protein [Ktedonobacteraceae bacterium]
MSLTRVSIGGTIQASHINQFCDVLQKASGQTETGKYYLQGGGYQSGWAVSMYMPTLSRGSTPVSVSIDTADQAPAASANSPSALFLTASGFQITFTVSALSNTARAAGNWTVTY